MQSLEFSGRDLLDAKRRALRYWYVNSSGLGLSVAEFFGRCRACNDRQARITFYPQGVAHP